MPSTWFGCLYVSCWLNSFRFGQLLRCADKRIVNIIKMYIERNGMQVELMRFRKKYLLYSRLLLRSEEFNGISHTFEIDVVLTHGKSFQHNLFPHSLFAWKVVTTIYCSISGNSNLICYSLLHFWRSRSTRDRE